MVFIYSFGTAILPNRYCRSIGHQPLDGIVITKCYHWLRWSLIVPKLKQTDNKNNKYLVALYAGSLHYVHITRTHTTIHTHTITIRNDGRRRSSSTISSSIWTSISNNHGARWKSERIESNHKVIQNCQFHNKHHLSWAWASECKRATVCVWWHLHLRNRRLLNSTSYCWLFFRSLPLLSSFDRPLIKVFVGCHRRKKVQPSIDPVNCDPDSIVVRRIIFDTSKFVLLHLRYSSSVCA